MSFNDEGLRTGDHLASVAPTTKIPSGTSVHHTMVVPSVLTIVQQQEKYDQHEKRMRLIHKKKRKREKLLRKLAVENEANLNIEKKQIVAELPSLHQPSLHDTSNESMVIQKPYKKRLKISIKKHSKSTSAIDSSKKYSKPSKISFPINEECTSLTLSPSGRTVIAGFTDGTLRLFDTTGRLWQPASDSKNSSLGNDPIQSEMNNLFDSDSDGDEDSSSKHTAHRAKQRMVASKSFQNYGAVACQILARGVITSLLMDVSCCEDGKYAFGGVLRGSTELVAVDLSLLEKYHDVYLDDDRNEQGLKTDILDLIKVHRHSDAKFKGFGACIRLKNTSRVEYRLFTGKGIKNMHIWSFIPPQGEMIEASWQCLYDTPSNGNTITYLKFRRDSNDLLQGISKSDDQKLRIWDLSYEERGDTNPQAKGRSVIKQLVEKAENETCEDRPKRPPYIDVMSTENALSVCGSYVFSGGDSMYNKMGVMFLDVEDIQSQFNHTELALPNANGVVENSSFGRRSARGGRQQRGDLKSVVRVSGLDKDAHHVLLELSDQTLVHYCQEGNRSSLTPLTLPSSNQIDRKICVTSISRGSTVLSISSYEENKSRGTITLKFLSENVEGSSMGCSARTGFTELRSKKKNIRLKKKSKSTAKLPIELPHANKEMKPLAPLDATVPVPVTKCAKRTKLAKEVKSTKVPKLAKEVKSITSRQPAMEIMHKSIITHNSSPCAMEKAQKIVSLSLESPTVENPSTLTMLTPMAETKHNIIPSSSSKKNKKMHLPISPEPKKTNTVASTSSEGPSLHQQSNKISKVESPGAGRQVDEKADISSPPINQTSARVHTKPTGVAVSPEQQTEKAASIPATVTHDPKSITKFFNKPKEIKKISHSSIKQAAKTSTRKPKKVQFKQVKRAVKKIPEPVIPMKSKEPQKSEKSIRQISIPRKKRSLQEVDIAFALSNLRKMGKSTSGFKIHNPSTDFRGLSGKSQEEMEQYLATCDKRKRPKFSRMTNLPSVAVRLAITVPYYKNTGTVFDATRINLNQSHFEARRVLVMHHRASHERLRSAIISSGERIINSISSHDGPTAHTKSQLIEFASQAMTEEIQRHRETLRNMIERQRLEASSLANSQLMEKGEKVPELAVSFPFPEIIDQVQASTMKFLMEA